MYTKLAQFGGFIFLVISCTKMIGMVYMFMTTGRFFLHHSLIYCTQIKEKKWVPYKSSLRATSSKPLNLFRLARKRVFYWHSQPDTCLPKWDCRSLQITQGISSWQSGTIKSRSEWFWLVDIFKRKLFRNKEKVVRIKIKPWWPWWHMPAIRDWEAKIESWVKVSLGYIVSSRPA
jgi:hypothetical protein